MNSRRGRWGDERGWHGDEAVLDRRSEMMRRTQKMRSSKGDDERAAMHACAWSRGRRASDEAVMTRTRHFGEDKGRVASQREEARSCGLGTKRE